MPLLLLLFIVVPLVELYVLLQVGQAIGVLPTIGLLVLDSILGSLLMRSQGRAAWRRFNTTMAEGRVPGREVLDGALIIFGGALLLTPGFTTDIVGLLLLLPPTRAMVRGVLVKSLAGRILVASPRFRPPRPPAGDGSAFDVEGTASDVRPDPRRLP